MTAAILIFAIMCTGFLLALYLRDNSIVDTIWGLGFVLLAWVLYAQSPSGHLLVLAVLVSLWGLRLSWHIGSRHLRKGQEDWRYAKWRQEWGKTLVWRSFLQVFMLQGFFMWIIGLPLQVVAWCTEPVLSEFWSAFTQGAGIALFLTGFSWEAIGDWQLEQFKRNPANRGKTMRSGLWRYSRHPNYFGEILVWWGLWLLSLPAGLGWLSLLSPIAISWLLLRVSGVPMLEAKYQDNPDYQEYIRNTPALFPRL
jgi:steroid 5-alpha reductase family enzyme